ncbi:transmembrane protein, putative [Medicago truncatula]|uniref:Transmembrane protein, putative n=1 Tax=Medicago truncatula TaxID=3880 RepID=G7KSL1_MEDTR|nr:transmembrane protein, putative [Medicago truncatula]
MVFHRWPFIDKVNEDGTALQRSTVHLRVSVILSLAYLGVSLSTPHLPQGHCFLLPALLFPPPLVFLQ